MCGIAGLISEAGSEMRDLRACGLEMTESLAHRGPDDWGIATFEGGQIREYSMTAAEGQTRSRAAGDGTGLSLILGHRRLAILDLSQAGHQPMTAMNGRYWIVYNGEIYNYRELKQSLEAQGVRFRSNSDTEVLLELFVKEGPACLEKLRGMFAFAIWDDKKRELFLARDRFGIKPLYYARGSRGNFLFASELKTLVHTGLIPQETDAVAEAEYLVRGSIRAPRTIYRSVLALAPGTWARWDGRNISVHAYWSLAGLFSETSSRPSDRNHAAERICAALTDSLKVHRVSDVPVGIFLSGGLDSMALLAGMRKFYSGPLKTFTLVFPGTPLDEGEEARRAAAFYGTDHTEMEVTREDFFRELDPFFRAMDQPTLDGLNTYFVAWMARKAGLKVSLSGLGGDEALGGYASFVQVPRWHGPLTVALNLPGFRQGAGTLVRNLPFLKRAKLLQILEQGPQSLENFWRQYRGVFTEEEIKEMGRTPMPLTEPARTGSVPLRGAFPKIAFLEMSEFMIPQLLRDTDVFTMAHGLELRVPFVDHVFLEKVLAAGVWSRGAAPSYKAALFAKTKDFLPKGYRPRSKRGFVLPFERWIRESLRETGNSGGNEGEAFRRFLGQSSMRAWKTGFERNLIHWSRIWALFVLERFGQMSMPRLREKNR